MTNTIISNDILKYVQANIEYTYYKYDLEDIFFLLNSSEEDFQDVLLSVAKKGASKGSSVKSVKDCIREEFINCILSCSDVSVKVIVEEDIKVYRVNISNKVIENHLVDRFRSAGVDIIESIEHREHEKLLTLFWKE